MFTNPTPQQLKDILTSATTIAVVGLSDNPARESHIVAQEMQRRGYRIIPVNPHVTEVLGEPAFARVSDIPFTVDIVNVFRRSEALASVVEDAVQTSAPVIWAQQGVYDEAAAQLAASHGKTMVMDACILVAHSVYVRS